LIVLSGSYKGKRNMVEYMVDGSHWYYFVI